MSRGHFHPADTRWPWAVMVALLASIPAFYDSLMPGPSTWAAYLYGFSGVVLMMALRPKPSMPWLDAIWRKTHGVDALLVMALLSCAALPASHVSVPSLTWRMMVALATLLRLIVLCQPWLARAGLVRMLAIATGLLVLCGLGFYWIDPGVDSLSNGLWLAFTTAATVGYGDVVPSTTASRIFAVFVVLLGYGILSLVTAGIAAMFVGSQERKVEHEILHDMHAQLKVVRREIAELRQDIEAARAVTPAASAPRSPDKVTESSGDHLKV
jgi:voltage-gated potassium channel